MNVLEILEFDNIDTSKYTKKCIKCGIVKPLQEFKKDAKRCVDGTVNTCKKCKNKLVSRAKELRDQYIRMHGRLPEYCQCCGKKDSNLVCDHDHKTGKLRGFVCQNCNRGIGLLGDSISGLEIAICYLKECNFK